MTGGPTLWDNNLNFFTGGQASDLCFDAVAEHKNFTATVRLTSRSLSVSLL